MQTNTTERDLPAVLGLLRSLPHAQPPQAKQPLTHHAPVVLQRHLRRQVRTRAQQQRHQPQHLNSQHHGGLHQLTVALDLVRHGLQKRGGRRQRC